MGTADDSVQTPRARVLPRLKELLLAGRYPEAEELCRGLHPDSCRSHIELAWAMCAVGEFTKAMRHAAQARARSPSDPTTSGTLAWISMRQGNMTEATYYAQRACALTNDPGQEELIRHIQALSDPHGPTLYDLRVHHCGASETPPQVGPSSCYTRELDSRTIITRAAAGVPSDVEAQVRALLCGDLCGQWEPPRLPAARRVVSPRRLWLNSRRVLGVGLTACLVVGLVVAGHRLATGRDLRQNVDATASLGDLLRTGELPQLARSLSESSEASVATESGLLATSMLAEAVLYRHLDADPARLVRVNRYRNWLQHREENPTETRMAKAITTSRAARLRMLELLERDRELNPQNPELAFLVADGLARAALPARAEAALREAAKLAPSNVMRLASVGRLHIHSGRTRQAMRIAELILDVAPRSPWASWARGVLGMPTQAEQQEPFPVVASQRWMDRALDALHKGDRESARFGIHQAMVSVGHQRVFVLDAADALLTRGYPAWAAEVIAGITPGNSDAEVSAIYGRLLLAQRQASPALDLLQHVWKQGDRDPAVGIALSEGLMVYPRSGNSPVTVATELIARWPERRDLVLLLARAYHAEGDVVGAATLLDAELSAGGGSRQLRAKMRGLVSKLRRQMSRSGDEPQDRRRTRR